METDLFLNFIKGSNTPVGANKVVQWIDKGGETFTHKMGYNNGSLLVEMEGHYYLYSKLTLHAADECSLIQHRVMKVTKAYGHAIELMQSKRFVGEPLLTSFLCWLLMRWQPPAQARACSVPSFRLAFR